LNIKPFIALLTQWAVNAFKTCTHIWTSERMWLHLPMGLVNGYALIEYPALGGGALVGFLVYEVSQDRSTQDQCHQDILGHVVGLFVTCIAMLVLDVLGVL
jgi:hypothetical protein